MTATKFCELCRADRAEDLFADGDDVCISCGGGAMVPCSGRDCASRLRRKWGDDVMADPLCGMCKPTAIPGFGKGPNVVYFIGCDDYIKIGFTRGRAQLDKRIKELQTGSPHRLELLAWMRGNWRLEQYLHEKFDHLHERGEWFKSHPELLDFMAKHRSLS